MPPLLLTLDRETAEKIFRLDKKTIAWCLTPCLVRRVPDSPDPDKTILGIRIERTLKRRIEVAAQKAGLTVTDFVRSILVEATAKVTLSSDEYRKIAEQVRKAELAARTRGASKRNDPRSKD
jgi:antitoxin component of RelBE/YafQ-DinJ toxin-antitoxin module